ncbi:MAG: flagellar hook-basal body complex protein [Jannaschia sp.]
MTISSSMNAGVAGLNVNASKLATISDNIANSSTYGYKRSTADFHSLVVGESKGAYSAGGVRVTTGRTVDQRGTLITTNNPTDLSIGGRGMLPVTPVTAVAAGGITPLQMTSTGSFRADADGVLRTASGLALLGWPAESDGTIPDFPRDTLGGLKPIIVPTNSLDAAPTTTIGLGVNLPATDAIAGSTGPAKAMTVEYYGNLGQPETLGITFTPTGTANQWALEIRDNAAGGTLVGEFQVTFDATAANGGTIDTVAVTGAGTWTGTTGNLSVTTASGNLDINIGRQFEPTGLSQLGDTFAPLSLTKDGSPVGTLAGLEVDAGGNLNAIYNTGFTKTLYKIPVIDVPNPNGLRALSNQTFQASTESGSFYLWDAGTGPVGDVVGFSREESTTDVASELTQLITTQRAYNSNAKVIQTVDEMLQETTNIKR